MNLEKELTRVTGNGIGAIHYDGAGRAIATNGYGMIVVDLESIGHEGSEKRDVIVKPGDNWICEKRGFPNWQIVVPRSWDIRHVGKLQAWKKAAGQVAKDNRAIENALNGGTLVRIGDSAFHPAILHPFLLTLQRIGGNGDVAAYQSAHEQKTSGAQYKPVVFVAKCGYYLAVPVQRDAAKPGSVWKKETTPLCDHDYNGIATGKIPHDSAEPIVWR